MLISLRTKGASWLIKILFGILIFSFGVWGIPDIYRNMRSTPVAATVGDVSITADELRRAVENQVKRIQAQAGGQLQPEDLRQLGIVDRTLEGLVERTLLEAYAADLDISVPDDLLEMALKSNPQLRDATGNIDPRRLDNMLRQLGLTQPEFIAASRRDIVSGFLIRAIVAGVQAPRSQTEAIYAYRAEQRVAHTLAIPDSSITDLPAPDAAAITKFYDDHIDRYQAPEYRGITLVRLTPEEHAKSITIGDEAVKAEYDARSSEFQIPEKRQIVQAVLPDEAAAKELATRVKQGTPFADAVKAAAGGDPVEVGTFSAADLQPRLAAIFSDAVVGRALTEALFAAPTGGASDPAKGPIGWHVLSVGTITPPNLQPLDDTLREKLRHDLAVRQALDDLVDEANRLDDELGGGAPLAEAADKLGLTVVTIPAVDRTGKAPDGTTVAAATSDKGEALQRAFETDQGQDSGLTETADGGYVILHVDSIQAAAARPLESARDKVIADWQEDGRRQAASAKAEAIVSRIKAGESIGKIANEMGVPVQVSQPFARGSGDPAAGIAGPLAEKLFAAKSGEAAADRAPADNAAVVAVLVEVKPADIAASTAEIDKLQTALGQSMGSDLYEQLSADLKQRIGVTRDQGLIDSIYQ